MDEELASTKLNYLLTKTRFTGRTYTAAHVD